MCDSNDSPPCSNSWVDKNFRGAQNYFSVLESVCVYMRFVRLLVASFYAWNRFFLLPPFSCSFNLSLRLSVMNISVWNPCRRNIISVGECVNCLSHGFCIVHEGIKKGILTLLEGIFGQLGGEHVWSEVMVGIQFHRFGCIYSNIQNFVRLPSLAMLSAFHMCLRVSKCRLNTFV